MIERILNLLASMTALLLVGIITLTISVGSLIVVPFVKVTQLLFNWPRKKP